MKLSEDVHFDWRKGLNRGIWIKLIFRPRIQGKQFFSCCHSNRC